MTIKKISLCQNEKRVYNTIPRSLSSDYESSYDFAYPLSYILALDCERIVYKMNEHNVDSSICTILNVTFVSDNTISNADLSDYIAFNQNDMRFVNVYLNPFVFNESDNEKKRKDLIDKIAEAIAIVIDEDKNSLIHQICDEVYLMADDVECVFLKKEMKKYDIEIRFKSSLNGYTATLYILNKQNNRETSNEFMQKCTFADLVYKINKVTVKNDKCIIHPKKGGFDKPIIIDIGC